MLSAPTRATCGRYTPMTWIVVLREAGDAELTIPPCRVQLVSLHQYIIEYHHDQSPAESFPDTVTPPLDPALVERCRAAMDVSVGCARPGISATQRQVLEELHSLRYAPSEEFVDDSTGYSIDAVVLVTENGEAPGSAQVATAPGNPVAVEVDGPSHFAHQFQAACTSSSAPSREGAQVRVEVVKYPCGGTAMKRRHLARGGYAVVSVPYWEWDSLNDDDERVQREARQRYLLRKLCGALS